MSVMMTNTANVEEKMAKMEHKVILLTKALEDKDLQIAPLMNKLKLQDLGESSHVPKFHLASPLQRMTKGKKMKILLDRNNLLRLFHYLSNNFKI